MSTAKKQKMLSGRAGSPPSLDRVNRTLLSLLKENGRATYAEIGKKAHLSAPAAYERIRRLEHSGVIQRHTVTIDSAKVGLPFCAFIRVGTFGNHGGDKIAASLAKHPEIEECHSVAGDDQFVLKVRTANSTDLGRLLEKIRAIPGIVTSVTTVVLLTHFERGLEVPLSDL